MAQPQSVTVLAAFPDTQTALSIHGGGNGMRVQLDIPETELGNAAWLMAWRQRVLSVTFTPTDSDPLQNSERAGSAKQGTGASLATRTERQSRWETTEAESVDDDPRASGGHGGTGQGRKPRARKAGNR